MVLNSEVERRLETHVTDTDSVGFPWLQGEKRLIRAVAFPGFTIDENAIWTAKSATTVEELLELSVAFGVPVVNKNSVVIFRVSVRDRDQETAVHTKATKGTSGTMHGCGRVVEVATDLILWLEMVCEVLTRRDWTHCSSCSILP